MTPIDGEDDKDPASPPDGPPASPPVEDPAMPPTQGTQTSDTKREPVTDQHRINAIRSLTESERNSLARRFSQIADVISEPGVLAGRIVAGARATPGGVEMLDRILKI